MTNEHDISEEDLIALADAKRLLESPGYVARLADAIGKPIEKLLRALPERASTAIQAATKSGLEKALEVALATMRHEGGSTYRPSNIWHQIAVAATGATGGVFGLAALPIELPVSTTIMLRSIADIARSKGEDLHKPESALACIVVFALGGRSGSDETAKSAYFAVRVALAKAVSEAAEYLAERTVIEVGSPAIVRLIAVIAQRFGIIVAEKAAAEFVPFVGALGGALVNVAFMDHFQDMAEGHFTVRSLERKYGTEAVRAAYEGASQ